MKNSVIFRCAITTVSVTGMMFFSTVRAGLTAPKDNVTICHRTGSATNPYVKITVSENAVPAHQAHGDSFPDAAGSCEIPNPGPTPDPTPVPTPVPVVLCIVSAGVTQTDTVVTGTAGDDTIDCTNASPGKTIYGGDGNDTITGTRFNDIIYGGNGNNTITGNGGNDTLVGGPGNDTITGGPGNDIIMGGGGGNDTLTGGGGIDVITP